VPSTSNLSPSDDIESNLVSTVRLLDLMVQMKVPRIVFLSSGGTVYGIPETTPIPETHPLNPICSYGIVKIAIEKYLHMYQQLYSLDYVVIRASNPYGERQGHKGVQGVIGTFLGKAKHSEEIQLWGDGSIIRDFIYVGDLAQFCIKVIHSNISGVYNVGSGVGHSISDIIIAIENNIGRNLSITKIPSRDYDIPKIILDISKAKNTFDWEPQIGFHQGIKKSWKWCISID
jgi:UDP-glucose 4-epimerase